MRGWKAGAAAAALGVLGVVVSVRAFNDPSDGRSSRPADLDRGSSAATTRAASPVSVGSSPPLSPAQSMVYEACAEPYRAQQVGLDLQAGLVHESPDQADARLQAARVTAARIASEAAQVDPEFADFAAAQAYWRDYAVVAVGGLPDPQLDAALAAVSEVCASVGVADGEDLIEIPYDALNANTAPRGRFDACTDLVFGEDGTVYADGERFTYDDCDRVTEPALTADSRDSGYRAAISLFLSETGGVVCWGEECHDEFDFSPH